MAFHHSLPREKATTEVGKVGHSSSGQTQSDSPSHNTGWMDPPGVPYEERCGKQMLTQERTFPSACPGLDWL